VRSALVGRLRPRARKDAESEIRDYFVVNPLTQSIAEVGCIASGVCKQLLDMASETQGICRKNEPEVCCIRFRKEIEMDFRKCLGASTPASPDTSPHRIATRRTDPAETRTHSRFSASALASA